MTTRKPVLHSTIFCYARKRGFTSIEIIVVIGIILIMAGILLPAVQAAREAARRSSCALNQRNIIQAAHAYESAMNRFPPESIGGRVKWSPDQANNFSVHTQLLRYMDFNDIHDSINFSVAGLFFDSIGAENYTSSSTSIRAFLCPSDSVAFRSPGATNYRANVGLCRRCYETESGAFSRASNATLAAFTDGLSNTISFSEKPVGTRDGPFENFRDWSHHTYSPIPITVVEWRAACSGQRGTPQYDSGLTWLLGGAIYTQFFVAEPPNSQIPDCGVRSMMGAGLYTARSYHPNGVNAAMADGSVRWFSSSINTATWMALGTRRGGELLKDEP